MTVQAQPAEDRVQDVVWAAARAKEEAGWVVHLLQGRAEIAYVQAVVQQFPMLPGSLVIKEVVQNVEQK